MQLFSQLNSSRGDEHMTINTTKVNLLKAELRLTNIALAERSGISRQSISTILQRGTCSPINAGKLAAGLGVSVADIVEESLMV